MTPGDAVREHVQQEVDRIFKAANLTSEALVQCYIEGKAAGHAEGRAEGLKEAAGLLCSHCQRGELQEYGHHLNCTDHTVRCSGCCAAWPIHRELARLRGPR